MKRLIVLLIAFSLSLTACNSAKQPQEPPLVNLQHNNRAVNNYYTKGQYDADVAQIAAEADEYIAKALKSGKFTKPAIVFDIDDTLLANHGWYKQMGYRFSSTRWKQWMNRGEIPAIEPMHALFMKYEKELDIFVITGRNIFQKAQTLRNLKAKGFKDWTTVFFKEAWDKDMKTGEFKKKIMNQLVNSEGFTIIANIGDQESDFGFPIKGREFRLPNYLYITK